jgi:hypothetical protein
MFRADGLASQATHSDVSGVGRTSGGHRQASGEAPHNRARRCRLYAVSDGCVARFSRQEHCHALRQTRRVVPGNARRLETGRSQWFQHGGVIYKAEPMNTRESARRYLDLDGREVHWRFIRAALASVADTAIVPAARSPRPWQRVADESARHRRWQLEVATPSRAACSRGRAELAVMTETYGRAWRFAAALIDGASAAVQHDGS